ncbi:MAG: hypothetical protein H8K07_20995 [Nitrospira sp.]|nr:hypothetical protein [Nitrospira sp.]
MPLKWHELPKLKSADQFHMDAVLERMKRRTPRKAPAKQQLPEGRE